VFGHGFGGLGSLWLGWLVSLDPEDISRLYRAHARDVLRFVARQTLQPEVAVDLVAETFAQALADRARFRGRGDGEALAWIFGIARHQLGKYFRRGVVERRALAKLGLELAAMDDADYERVEQLSDLGALRGALADGLAALSEEHREALRLRIVEERSYTELADALGVSEQTARARVSRALRALAKETTNLEGSPRYA
jgi:RNA polymerase sigma-70 factor, ECF subfamily